MLNVVMMGVVALIGASSKNHPRQWQWLDTNPQPGNTKGESITVPLTSCLTGLD